MLLEKRCRQQEPPYRLVTEAGNSSRVRQDGALSACCDPRCCTERRSSGESSRSAAGARGPSPGLTGAGPGRCDLSHPARCRSSLSPAQPAPQTSLCLTSGSPASPPYALRPAPCTLRPPAASIPLLQPMHPAAPHPPTPHLTSCCPVCTRTPGSASARELVALTHRFRAPGSPEASTRTRPSPSPAARTGELP